MLNKIQKREKSSIKMEEQNVECISSNRKDYVGFVLTEDGNDFHDNIVRRRRVAWEKKFHYFLELLVMRLCFRMAQFRKKFRAPPLDNPRWSKSSPYWAGEQDLQVDLIRATGTRVLIKRFKGDTVGGSNSLQYDITTIYFSSTMSYPCVNLPLRSIWRND